MQTIQSRAVADAPRDATQDRQVGMGRGIVGAGEKRGLQGNRILRLLL